MYIFFLNEAIKPDFIFTLNDLQAFFIIHIFILPVKSRVPLPITLDHDKI